MPSQRVAKYSNSTASANALKTGEGTFFGVIVNSNTSGTIKIYDSLTQANTIIMNTYTFPAGSSVILMPASGVSFYTGLSYTIGGTADVTILYY